MANVTTLIEVAFYKPLHVRDANSARVAVKDLQIDRWKMMVRIGIELSLKLRQRFWLDGSTGRVGIAHLIRNSVNPRIHSLERAQHVVKRPIFHHEHDDVLEIL